MTMSNTAYTIGYTPGYDEALARDPLVNKTGRREGYAGGIVWRKSHEALNWIGSPGFEAVFPNRADEFSVYELLLPTDWDTDVYTIEERGTHHLINDALIVAKVHCVGCAIDTWEGEGGFYPPGPNGELYAR
jgi:hypothetical protein